METLVEADALKLKDEFHIARWVVPLAMGVAGLATFIPLALTISPLFLIGAVGVPLVGGILGMIFHTLARRITPTEIRLRKRCRLLMMRLNGLKNILGFDPVLSPKVAAILEEAATLYLKVRPTTDAMASDDSDGLWSDAFSRARHAMDEAMAQMLALAEPETALAQDAELAYGWALPLLEEMRATARIVEEHAAKAHGVALADQQLAPLAGLRDARAELQRLESAVSELEQGAL